MDRAELYVWFTKEFDASAHYTTGCGSRTFNDSEKQDFFNKVCAMLEEQKKTVDPIKLAFALINTARKHESFQDQAEAIIPLL
jgi:hypothetical protein